MIISSPSSHPFCEEFDCLLALMDTPDVSDTRLEYYSQTNVDANSHLNQFRFAKHQNWSLIVQNLL